MKRRSLKKNYYFIIKSRDVKLQVTVVENYYERAINNGKFQHPFPPCPLSQRETIVFYVPEVLKTPAVYQSVYQKLCKIVLKLMLWMSFCVLFWM